MTQLSTLTTTQKFPPQVKLLQYPMLAVLGYFLIKFEVENYKGQLVFDSTASCRNKTTPQGEPECLYCPPQTIYMAWITFSFQVIYGLWVLLAERFTWYVNTYKDGIEETGERRLKKGNTRAKIQAFFLRVAPRPFFDNKITGAMLSISVAWPLTHKKAVIKWFLAAGVMGILVNILADMRDRTSSMAHSDNKLRQSLRYLNIPLFVGQIIIFTNITWDFMEYDLYVTPKAGIAYLTAAVIAVCFVALLFRAIVINGALAQTRYLVPDQLAKTTSLEQEFHQTEVSINFELKQRDHFHWFITPIPEQCSL